MAKKKCCPLVSVDSPILSCLLWGIVFSMLFFMAQGWVDTLLVKIMKGLFAALAAYFILSAAGLTEELYD